MRSWQSCFGNIGVEASEAAHRLAFADERVFNAAGIAEAQAHAAHQHLSLRNSELGSDGAMKRRKGHLRAGVQAPCSRP